MSDTQKESLGLYWQSGARLPDNIADLDAISLEDAKRMLCDLWVRQVELERLNDEMRQAEQEVGEERARYFDLYDLAPLGYLTLDTQGLILEANLVATALLGVDRNQLLGQPFTSFILADAQDSYELLHKELSGTGAPQACDLRLYHKDYGPFWAHLQAYVTLDFQGAQLYRAVINDISERKQIEAQREAALEALRESEECFRCIFDQSPIGAAILTLDYRFVRANQTLCDMLQYSAEELPSMSFIDITHSEDLAANLRQTQRLLAGEIEQFDMDKRYIRKDGGIVCVHLSVRLVKNTAGKPLFFLSMMIDISERVQAESRCQHEVAPE